MSEIVDKEFDDIMKQLDEITKDENNSDKDKDEIMWSISPPYTINNLDDMIEFCWKYRGEDWESYWKLIPSLTLLQNVVGMKALKEDIVNMIMYYGCGYESKDGDLMHTVLYGPPGVGKTMVAQILAQIFGAMGFLSKGHVVYAKREDFIGKYIGHSEPKTSELLESALGGVLFIDEVYSMGSDNTDSFSKAIVDKINSFLSEHKKDFVCIIAGYEKDVKRNFFAINQGLESRFTWKYTLPPYSAKELFQIFKKKVENNGWTLSNKKDIEGWFNDKKDAFPAFGRDIEVFFSKCKIVHTRRSFCNPNDPAMSISLNDVKQAFELLNQHKNKSETTFNHMYI